MTATPVPAHPLHQRIYDVPPEPWQVSKCAASSCDQFGAIFNVSEVLDANNCQNVFQDLDNWVDV